MKTHKLLHSYRHLPNYAEIAQAAASWAKANPHATPDELMAWVAAAYPTEAMLTIAEEPAPFVVFGEPEKHIPINAIEQMQMVMRLPVAQRGALMPDAHLGYAMPIGGVVSLDDAISPSFVGYDISCMMQLSLFDLTPQEFMKHRRRLAGVLRSETRFGLGADFKPGQRQHAVMDDPRWSETRLLRSLKTLAGKQLGSSGGGNHFAELQVVDGKTRVNAERNELTTAGYGLVNLRASYEWKQVRLDVGIDNLFDRFYHHPQGGAYLGQGMTMAGTAVPWGVRVPGMGRSVNVGVTVKF